MTASLLGGLAGSGIWLLRAQNPFQTSDGTALNIAHAECTYFGAQRERFTPKNASQRNQLGDLTSRITGMLGTSSSRATGMQPLGMASAPGGSRTSGRRSRSRV
jgi:hypothetical protein